MASDVNNELEKWFRQEQNDLPQHESQNILQKPNIPEDPVIGTWYDQEKTVKACFYMNGTFDIIRVNQYGQDNSYIGGIFRKVNNGNYIVRTEAEGRSKQEARPVTRQDRQFIQEENRLLDIDDTILFFRDNKEHNGPEAKEFDANGAQGPYSSMNGSSYSATKNILFQLTLTVVTAVLVLLLFAVLIVFLPVYVFLVETLHLVIFDIFIVISLFICALIFILSYFGSPFDVEKMPVFSYRQYRSESMIERYDNDKYRWSRAIYNNLDPGDRSSRATFCFAYTISPMFTWGGFILILGAVVSGVFGQVMHIPAYMYFIPMIIWLAIGVIGLVLRRYLMGKFVNSGIIKVNEPIPSLKDYRSF